VLKDAAASSIYGSRAAFGVVLVTTKKGKEGTTVINYNNNFRWNSPLDMPDMMDSYTFALFFNDANTNGGSSPFFGSERLQRIKDYQEGKITNSIIPNPNNPSVWADGYAEGNDNVDWYDALYRKKAFSQEHNVSISGGNDKLNYYASGNYLNQNGLMKLNQDIFDRYTTTLKLKAKLSESLQVNLSNRYIREDYGRPSSLTNSLYQDLARQGWPVLPLYDPNGYLYSSPSPALGLRDGGRDKSQNDWFYQQLQLIFEPIKGWKTLLNLTTGSEIISAIGMYKKPTTTTSTRIQFVQFLHRRYEYGFRENYLNTNVYSEYNRSIKRQP
jgi:TonB-dependent SusC/RagA subfamily outer membrane receptor